MPEAVDTLWKAVGAAVGAQRGAPPLERVSRDGVLRASFAQQRLWFLDRLAWPSAMHNQAVVCRLQGRLDDAALADAITEMVRRHEALRTALEFAGGELVQRILPAGAIEMPLDDLRTCDAANVEARAHALAAEEARRPLDAAQPPLLRTRLLRLRDEEHWLVLTFHHLAFDGWSFEVLMAELCAVYGAFALGRPSPLPEPQLQYADFAAWQRRWLGEEQVRPLLDRWVERMAAPRPDVCLPSDRARGKPLPRPGASASIVLSPQLTGALKALCAREHATPYMVLLAAFQAVLHRHTGEDEVIVGSPVANRNRVELEKMVGLLANTMALRVSLAGEPTFRELLGRVRSEALEAFAHQDLPFEMLVEALDLPRGADALPLFRVMFAYQNVPRSSWAFPGLRTDAWNVDSGVAKCDLALSMKEADGCFHGLAEFDASLFDAAAIEDLLGHFRAFLEAVAADPDARVDSVELLSGAERSRWLVDWNATTTDYPREASIHRLFEAVARERPDAPALAFDGGAWSYAELNRRANRLSRHLVALGLRPGELVVVHLERSPDLIAALLAVLKAGAAFVPSSPSDQRDRLQRALAGAGVAGVISSGAAGPGAVGRWRVMLDIDATAIAQHSEADGDLAGAADALAYVMFTSGSSGAPKGVCIPNRGVTRLVRGTNYVSISHEDVLLQLAPVSFDASTFEIWGALLNGATLAIASPGPLSLREIGEEIRARGVTVLWLTAGLFEAFIDERPADLDGLRELLVGGDTMSPRHARDFLRRGGRCRLVNCYGPTENTTFTTFHHVADVPEEETGGIPIGRPIANTRLYVLDAHLRPVPPGALGEACVAGDGLMREYLGDAALTREKLQPDPFAPGSLLYRTGDRVRLRRDGELEFVGRLDDQVKIRGFRVEPSEVEALLARLPGVERAVVVARRPTAGVAHLAAYLVAAAPGAATELGAQAREFLRSRVPEAWIPETWAVVDAIPLTAQGKLDRAALEALAGASPPAPGQTAPRDPLEEMLARAFADVLGVGRIGIHDDFFERGGHSLLALRLLERLERDLAAPIPLGVLFRHRSVAGLAAALRCKPAAVPSATPRRLGALVEIRPGPGEPALFVVPGGHGGMIEMTLYAKLMAHVEGELAVYGLLAQVPGGADATCRPVAQMAEALLAEMRRMRPRGPYALAGECVGGVVALEMAQRLRAQGEDVSLLLLDSWCPTDAGERHYWRVERPQVVARERVAMATAGLRSLARELRAHVRARPAFGARAWASHAYGGAAQLWRRSATGIARVASAGTTPGLGSESADALARNYVEQAMRYRPSPYDGPVRLVVSAHNHALGLVQDWEPIARGGLEVRVVPGSHDTYIRDTAAQTAHALAGWLPLGDGSAR